MPYDSSTGLVFAETVIRLPSSNNRRRLIKNAAHGIRASELRPKPHPDGARKLAETAMLVMLRNLDGLTPEVLQSLETMMLERIWGAVKES
jgi:hypothetical protein